MIANFKGYVRNPGAWFAYLQCHWGDQGMKSWFIWSNAINTHTSPRFTRNYFQQQLKKHQEFCHPNTFLAYLKKGNMSSHDFFLKVIRKDPDKKALIWTLWRAACTLLSRPLLVMNFDDHVMHHVLFKIVKLSTEYKTYFTLVVVWNGDCEFL